MITSRFRKKTAQVVELTPSYKVPLGIMLIAPGFWFLQPWVAGIVFLFGVFLWVQGATLRLKFTATDMDLWRGETLVRRFPYAEWVNWRIFWSPIPILFYFKEVNSIHFMPILFDPKTLQICLEKYCKRI